MVYDQPRAYGMAEALQAALDAVPGVQAYILTPLDDRPSGGYVWAQVGAVQSWADRMDGLASDASGSIILRIVECAEMIGWPPHCSIGAGLLMRTCRRCGACRSAR